MAIPPLTRNPFSNHSSVAGAPLKQPRPQGFGQTPDHLERVQESPPSLFKKFLFVPILQMIRYFLRGIFTLVDLLRTAAFEEKSEPFLWGRKGFLEHLHEIPSPQALFLQFQKVYSPDEQDEIYQAIGAAYKGKTSWKEIIWQRTPQENIEIGRKLIRQNPFLLRNFL